MSTYVLMKLFETAPERYDLGIRLLTFGRLDKNYNRLITHIKKGDQVLDLGCGTGALTLKAARQGARVKGIDVSALMLKIARRKATESGLDREIEFVEQGVAELSKETTKSYDVVMSGLCFSELTADELRFALPEVKRVLKPGGLLLVADEVKPKNILLKIINDVIRFPLVLLTYVLTQTSTQAIADLPNKLKAAGFLIETVSLSNLGSFMSVVARKA